MDPDSSHTSHNGTPQPSSFPMLSSIDLTVLAKTLNFNLPIKLDSSNYIYWKAQVLPAIRALELDEFISEGKSAPPRFIEVQLESGEQVMEQNKLFVAWRRADQLLLCWPLSTISQDVIGQVTECATSYEVWRTLENLYSQMSMARVLQLKQQLQNTKKGAMSISEFFLKIKTIGDSLKTAGQIITDNDLIFSAMNGLGHEFDPVVVFVSLQLKTMNLQDVQYLLMVHEQRLEQLNSVSQINVLGASA